MARTSPLQVVAMNGYMGGLNKDANVARLEPTEMPEALNVVLGIRGEVSKRHGYIRFDSNVGARVETLFSWSDPAGVDHMVMFDVDGNCRSNNDSSDVFNSHGWSIGTGGSAAKHPVARAVALGKLYVSSRRGPDTRKWTGSGAWTDATSVPRCQFMRWRFEQLFVANIAGNPSQMRVSLELAPEDFTTTPAIFEFDPEDGYEIRGLAASGDDLLVFKDHSIHVFSGRVRSDFQKYRLDSLRGTYSPRTIDQVRGILIFFDRDTGVWAWDGANFTLISEKLNAYILNNQTYNQAYRAIGFVWRDLYFLSLPWQGSTIPTRTFVYSTLTNSWVEWDFGAWDATLHLNNPYVASPRDADGIHQFNTGFLDAGAPIEMRFKTPWMQPGGPGSLSRLRRLEANMAASGADVEVSLFQEYDTAPLLTRQISATNQNLVSEASVIKNLDGWMGRADVHQLEFSSLDEFPFQLNHAHCIFSVNEDRLGEHV